MDQARLRCSRRCLTSKLEKLWMSMRQIRTSRRRLDSNSIHIRSRPTCQLGWSFLTQTTTSISFHSVSRSLIRRAVYGSGPRKSPTVSRSQVSFSSALTWAKSCTSKTFWSGINWHLKSSSSTIQPLTCISLQKRTRKAERMWNRILTRRKRLCSGCKLRNLNKSCYIKRIPTTNLFDQKVLKLCLISWTIKTRTWLYRLELSMFLPKWMSISKLGFVLSSPKMKSWSSNSNRSMSSAKACSSAAGQKGFPLPSRAYLNTPTARAS